MARTLYIIDDAILESLGSTIIAKMMDEVKSIFTFASKFNVLMTTPDSIPEKIYFTDSIVKVVATDNDVTAMQNQVEQQQLRSIDFAIKKRKLDIKCPHLSETPLHRNGAVWVGRQKKCSP